jgi:hypothetical protein
MNRQQRKFVKAVIQHALENSTHCDTYIEHEEFEVAQTSAARIVRDIEREGMAELYFIQTHGDLTESKGAFLFIDQDDDPDSPFADYISNDFCDAAIAAGWEAIA